MKRVTGVVRGAGKSKVYTKGKAKGKEVLYVHLPLDEKQNFSLPIQVRIGEETFDSILYFRFRRKNAPFVHMSSDLGTSKLAHALSGIHAKRRSQVVAEFEPVKVKLSLPLPG